MIFIMRGTNMPKCASCGITGDYPEIDIAQTYIGGIGYRLIHYCVDRLACTRRVDIKAGYLEANKVEATDSGN